MVSSLYAADGFTQKDRELLIELKMKMLEIDRRFEQVDKRFEQVDKRFEQVDKRFEQVDKRFEQVDKRSDGIERRLERLESVMMWGFGLLFSSMLGLFSFVLWDRKTALSPAIRKSRELEEREEIIEKALKEYAKIEPRFAEILKTVRM
jgi:predicted  nucleic acid-binding Zn-ribbon protein